MVRAEREKRKEQANDRCLGSEGRVGGQRAGTAHGPACPTGLVRDSEK